jgi:hypothetical protein
MFTVTHKRHKLTIVHNLSLMMQCNHCGVQQIIDVLVDEDKDNYIIGNTVIAGSFRLSYNGDVTPCIDVIATSDANVVLLLNALPSLDVLTTPAGSPYVLSCIKTAYRTGFR